MPLYSKHHIGAVAHFGRASCLHREGSRFDSVQLHKTEQYILIGKWWVNHLWMRSALKVRDLLVPQK